MAKKRIGSKMTIVLLFLLAALLLLLVACGGGGGGGKSAGVKDGAIELLDARVDFGSNQVPDSSKSTLTVINLKDTDHEAIDGINSNLFELYLDEQLDEPITVTIPVKDTKKPEGDDIQPALGLGIGVTSAVGAESTLYSYIPAELVGDNVVATFVPSEYMDDLKVNGANGEARPHQERMRFGFFWLQTHFKDGGHFLVEFPVQTGKFFLDYKVRNALLNDLEDVYEAYLAKGYTYSNRSSWPMKVNIQSISQEGYYSYKPWAPAGGSINLNRQFFENNQYDATKVKPLLAHEFFHFVQGNYVGFTTDLLWFDEATATYFESEKSGEIPSIVSEYKEKLWSGVFPKDNTAPDGYSRMPLVKFLSKKVGEDRIRTAYEMVDDGVSWEDALLSAFGPPANWAPDYYKAVTTGEVTDYAPYTLHSRISGGDADYKHFSANINLEIPSPEKIKDMLEKDEAPLLGKATLNIEALGAGLVAINIDDKNLDKLQDDMDPIVTAEGANVTVVSAKSRAVETMAGGALTNFKKASKDKTVYLAIITGLHEKGSKSYEVKVEFPAAPTLDEVVGTYKDGTILFEEVYIDPSAWDNVDDNDGCDAQVLGMLKGMEGQTKNFNLAFSKTGDNTGSFLFYQPGDDPEDGIDYIPFTYNNGQLIFDSSDDEGVYTGNLTAAYGQNQDITINGKLKLAQEDDMLYMVVVIKGTKPL